MSMLAVSIRPESSLHLAVFSPGITDLAQNCQLAGVVGRVVGYEQDLAQEGVVRLVREWRQQVSLRVFHDPDQVFQIFDRL
ncbi:hypothetical protein BH24CHL1_BH24CHL1_09780 [soil metagenome]